MVIRQTTSSLTARRRKFDDGFSRSLLTQYFMVTMFLFAFMLLGLNNRFTNTVMLSTMNDMENHLQSSLGTPSMTKRPSSTDGVLQTKAQSSTATSNTNQHEHRLAGLNCEKWGGPSDEEAQEMVYWEDIPSDAHHVSPFKMPGISQYMTFEPDSGGWNNIRMAMESLLVRWLFVDFHIAIAVGFCYGTHLLTFRMARPLHLQWVEHWYCPLTNKCIF